MNTEITVHGDVKLKPDGRTFSYLVVNTMTKADLNIKQSPPKMKWENCHFFIVLNIFNRTVNGTEGEYFLICAQKDQLYSITSLIGRLDNPTSLKDASAILQHLVLCGDVVCAVHDDPSQIINSIDWGI